MHKRGGKVLVVLFFLCTFLIHSTWGVKYDAVDSIYDLTDIEFNNLNVVTLNGIWEVYEGEILYQEDFDSKNFNKYNYKSQFINLPTNYYTNFYGARRASHGPDYGTLKAKVKIDKENIGRKLYLGNSLFNENVNIWINGKLIVNTGIVSNNVFDAKQVNQPSEGYFYVTKDTFDIIIHYSHFYDGPSLNKGIVIGSQEAVEHSIVLNMIIEIALISTIFMLILYHFMFYFNKERKIVSFYFFAYAFLLLLRVLNLGSNSLSYIIGFVDFPLYIKISYGSFYMLMPMIAIFLLENGYLPFVKKSLKFMKIYAMVLMGIIIVLPADYIVYYVFPAVIVNFIWLIIYIRRIIDKNIHSESNFRNIAMTDWDVKENASKRLAYVGVVIGGIFLLCDYLYQVCLIHSKFYLVLGIIGFVIIESIVISKKYSGAFEKISQLYDKNKNTATALSHAKIELENLIEVTGQLTKDEQIELIDQNEQLKLFLDKIEDLCLVVNAHLKVEQVFSKDSKMNTIIGRGDSILRLYKNDKEHQLMIQSAVENLFACKNEGKRQLYMELLPDEIFIVDRYYSVRYQYIPSREYMIIELQDHSKYTKKLYRLEREREIAYMMVRVMMEKTSFNYNLWQYHHFAKCTVFQLLKSQMTYEEKIYQLLMKIHTFKSVFSKYHMTSGGKILNYVERELLLLKDDQDITEEDLKEIIEDYELEKVFDQDLEAIKERLLFSQYNELIQFKDYDFKKVNLKTMIEEDLLSLKDMDLAKHKSLTEVKVNGDNIMVSYEEYYDLIKSFHHIYNNIVDHGIEASRYRERIGKSPKGTLKIDISQLEEFVEIIIADDGRGLDVNQIKEKLYSQNIIEFDKIVSLSDEETFTYIFEKGFSTMSKSSNLSGRGVGLYAIKDIVKKMDGHITVQSKMFEFTKFRVLIPKSND